VRLWLACDCQPGFRFDRLSGVLAGPVWPSASPGQPAAWSCTVTHPAEEEGHGEVRRGSVRAGVVVTLVVAAVSSCGTPAPTHSASPSASSTVALRPSAAAGPCASVTTTTAIGQVPAECAAVWAPYGVTKVPPANLLDATPVPPPVTNGTNGAVSDTEAESWALASNRGSVWYRWSEANDQPTLLSRIGKISLLPPPELQILDTNGTVSQPDCAIFPIKVSAFEVGPDGIAFFSSLGQEIRSGVVFVGRFPGPCSITATTATGQVQTIASFATAGATFFAGHVVDDPLLGEIWFTDGAGNCSQRGAPPAWCT
jgi:hypothetical protein